MKLPVAIPEPCYEQWDDMQARDNGRHCFACQKTVVDFTGWEVEDILSYLKANRQTCGRFTADQLHQTPKPANPVNKDFSWWPSIMRSGLSAVGKIAAAVVLLFHLASCDTVNETHNNKAKNQLVTVTGALEDTSHTGDILGGITIMGDTIIPPAPQKPKPVVVKQPEPVIMGEPAIVEDSPVVTIPEPKPQIMGAAVMSAPTQDSLTVLPRQ